MQGSLSICNNIFVYAAVKRCINQLKIQQLVIFHPENDFLVRYSNAIRYNFCVINSNKVIDCFYPHIGAQHAYTIRSYDETVMNRYCRTVYDCDCSSCMFYRSTSSCRDCIKVFCLPCF